MDISKYLVRPEDSIQAVIKVIDNNKDGIALVVNENGILVGTITDGDIRRYMLSGCSFGEPCIKVMHDKPIVADVSARREELTDLIKKYRIRNIPLIDELGRPVKVVNFNSLMNNEELENIAVIMAGGEGLRLRPLTETIPKPMIHVGESPLLEQIIRSLRRSGIHNIFIALNYRGEIIEKYFEDGSQFNVRIRYLREEKKLGTAGALSLLTDITKLPLRPILVMNGDIMTDVNFERLLEFHRQHRSVMSIAAIDYHLSIPYGVLEIAGHYVLGLEEKPTKRVFCNAGIYAIDPDMIQLIPKETYYDMNDLLKGIIEKGYPVSAFPIHEYWVDIGDKEDLKLAKDNVAENYNGQDREG